jgi:hypothetical protein
MTWKPWWTSTTRSINPMEVDRETIEEGGIMEVATKVIEVNNQVMVQITTTLGYLNTWQITIIKGNMT